MTKTDAMRIRVNEYVRVIGRGEQRRVTEIVRSRDGVIRFALVGLGLVPSHLCERVTGEES